MSDELFDRSEFVSYFRDETAELLDRIDADLLGLETTLTEGSVDADVINAIFRSLHTIKGSAGMLDFTTIQRLAHRMENSIDLVRSNIVLLDDALLSLIFTGRDLLSEAVTRAVNGNAEPIAEIEPYIAQLEAAFAAKQLRALENPPVSPEAEAEEAAPANLTDTITVESLEAEKIAAFEAEVARLLAEQTGTGKSDPTPVSSLPVVANSMLGGAVGTMISEVLKPVPKEVPPEKTSSAPAPIMKPVANSTIRVDLQRLDTLLNLVGELVINRTRITEIAHDLQRTIDREAREALPLAKDLAATASVLARITNELQESVMKARMVPIGQVFERFPRTVRDLAKTTGKSINLLLAGVDTDLDKTIVDQIGEPLMHLVRNCADHGIEMPDVREQAGKSAAATIRLDAYHEGNQVIIEIGDDGGGIDVRKIRARGIERGLIDADREYSDKEIVDLIFTPGFSTAQTVSAISGRGVGMDVVKRSVMDLKGVLEVNTKLGVGTTFTIRLPLTLAIIRTLLVRVAGRLFAIPLDVVVESQRIPRSDIRTIGGSPVVSIRGQVLPLINVAREFELSSQPVEEGYEMIVIVSHKGRRVGFVVDGFEGEQEIVIKPLSSIIGETGCIAGATILGNGSIALILDVAGMVNGLPDRVHEQIPPALEASFV